MDPLIRYAGFVPRYLANSDTIAVAITDLSGIYLYINPLFVKISPKHTHILGQLIASIFHSDDIIACQQALAQCAAHPSKSQQLHVRMAASADHDPLLWELTLLRDAVGNAVGVIWIGAASGQQTACQPPANPATDAPHLPHQSATASAINTEIALLESEERYRAIISSMQEGVVIQALDGSIIGCNTRAEQILGLSYDQMAGLTSLDPNWRSVHQDGSPFPGEDHPAMVTLRTGQPQQDVIMGVHKPDGTLTWISIYSQLLNRPYSNKEPYAVFTIFHDITHRMLHEQQLQLLSMVAMRTSNAVVITDVNRRISWVNEGFSRLTGYTMDEVVGKKPGALLQCEETDNETVVAMREAFDAAKPFKGEIFNKSKDNKYYWLDLDIQPIFDDEKKLTGFIAIESDITERKNYESKIKYQNEILKQLTFEQSHVLRKPIASILGLCIVIEYELNQNEKNIIKQYIEMVRKSAEEADLFIHYMMKKINKVEV